MGSKVALARHLGVTKAAVGQWRLSGRGVPLEHCVQIEVASNKAVMRWDLRPEDWYRIWPELIHTAGAPRVPEPASSATTVKG